MRLERVAHLAAGLPPRTRDDLRDVLENTVLWPHETALPSAWIGILATALWNEHDGDIDVGFWRFLGGVAQQCGPEGELEVTVLEAVLHRLLTRLRPGPAEADVDVVVRAAAVEAIDLCGMWALVPRLRAAELGRDLPAGAAPFWIEPRLDPTVPPAPAAAWPGPPDAREPLTLDARDLETVSWSLATLAAAARAPGRTLRLSLRWPGVLTRLAVVVPRGWAVAALRPDTRVWSGVAAGAVRRRDGATKAWTGALVEVAGPRTVVDLGLVAPTPEATAVSPEQIHFMPA